MPPSWDEWAIVVKLSEFSPSPSPREVYVNPPFCLTTFTPKRGYDRDIFTIFTLYIHYYIGILHKFYNIFSPTYPTVGRPNGRTRESLLLLW
jgi:hypothetical protein